MACTACMRVSRVDRETGHLMSKQTDRAERPQESVDVQDDALLNSADDAVGAASPKLSLDDLRQIIDQMVPDTPQVSGDATEPLDALPAIIEWVIASYYAHYFEPFFSRVTDDCSFIGAGNMSYFSRDEMLQALEGEETAPRIFMRNVEFRVLETPDPSATEAIVFGTYDLITNPLERMIHAAHQRISVCCRLTDEGWKAHHIHSSNEWNELVDEDTFPIKISKDTYQFVLNVLRAGKSTGTIPQKVSHKVMREAYGKDRVVIPDAIVYIEAKGKHCLVHEVGGSSYTLRMLLGDAEEQLGDRFVRVHRSYLVNTAYVQSMQRGVIELSDGTELPVSGRRYADVRSQIAGLLTAPAAS